MHRNLLEDFRSGVLRVGAIVSPEIYGLDKGFIYHVSHESNTDKVVLTKK